MKGQMRRQPYDLPKAPQFVRSAVTFISNRLLGSLPLITRATSACSIAVPA